MKASQMIYKLLDRMADIGDFDVDPGFWTMPEGWEKPLEIQQECPINRATQEGIKAAQTKMVDLEHNPYEKDSPEADAWEAGYKGLY